MHFPKVDFPQPDSPTRPRVSPFLIDKSISPKQYKVGPGDQIHINIISSNETFDYSIVISPTGELLIPSVGLINTNKLSLYELIKKINSDKVVEPKNFNDTQLSANCHRHTIQLILLIGNISPCDLTIHGDMRTGINVQMT